MLISDSGLCPVATVILIKWKRGTFDYRMISAENIYVQLPLQLFHLEPLCLYTYRHCITLCYKSQEEKCIFGKRQPAASDFHFGLATAAVPPSCPMIHSGIYRIYTYLIFSTDNLLFLSLIGGYLLTSIYNFSIQKDNITICFTLHHLELSLFICLFTFGMEWFKTIQHQLYLTDVWI